MIAQLENPGRHHGLIRAGTDRIHRRFLKVDRDHLQIVQNIVARETRHVHVVEPHNRGSVKSKAAMGDEYSGLVHNSRKAYTMPKVHTNRYCPFWRMHPLCPRV